MITNESENSHYILLHFLNIYILITLYSLNNIKYDLYSYYLVRFYHIVIIVTIFFQIVIMPSPPVHFFYKRYLIH